MQSSIGKPFEGQKGPLKDGCIEEEARLAESRQSLWRTSVAPREPFCSILKRRHPGTLLLQVVPRCQFCRSIPTCRLLIGWLASALHSHWSRPDSASRSPLDRQWGKCAVVGWWL